MDSSIVLGAVLLCTAFVAAEDHVNPLSDEFIALINSEQNSWTAGRNFPADTPMANLKPLTGTLVDDLLTIPVKEHESDLIASLPDNFDARQKWPNCPTIHQIIDQGCCDSAWAVGAVQVMSDRICIYSNGTVNIQLSVQDILSCATRGNYGCRGGAPVWAWRYWMAEGIVSGGQYSSSDGCIPYAIHGGTCKFNVMYTPVCSSQCIYGSNITYDDDKHRGKKIYGIRGEDNMKAELFKNGPLEVVMNVYEDFLNYKEGIYSHTTGRYLGLHAIKLLAWGVENGTKYWLLANSWGSTWGDKGYFKCVIGRHGCSIEYYYSIAGEPA